MWKVMNFFKRALASIKRRPSKSVILLLLVFILGTIISGAISVRGAVVNTEVNLRNRMRPVVSFARNWEAQNEYFEETGEWIQEGRLTADIVRAIAELPYVNRHHYSVRSWFQTPSLQFWQPWMDDSDGFMMDHGSDIPSYNIIGSSAAEPLEFVEEFIRLTSGRVFTEGEISSASALHPILISEGFARHNNLSVGDVFDIEILGIKMQEAEIIGGIWDPDWNSNPDNVFDQVTVEFHVIGLFAAPLDASGGDRWNHDNEADWEAQHRLDNLLTSIFMTNHSAIYLQGVATDFRIAANLLAIEMFELDDFNMMWLETERDEEFEVTSVMELEDPTDIEAFREAATPLLPDFWEVEDLANTFADISTSMESLQGIADMVLWVSVVATLLILSLLITLFLRDRRHEMGVYLALGEKKKNIISQILVEVVATAFIGITLSVFSGNIISSTMSRNMLRNELITQREGQFDLGWGIGRPIGGGGLADLGFAQEMTIEDMIEAYDVSLSLGTIGILYGVGLGAVVLSTIAPVMYVITLNPKKVLM